MDKKLIISRNMNKELKNTTKKFRSKDVVNERYTGHAASTKQYHTSQNYYHRTPPKNFDNKKCYTYLPDTVSLSNEEFIHANAQIWLNEDSLQTNYDYNDIYNQWDLIVQINFYSTEEVVCPICLDIPTVSRTDKCGHIYCFPCLNKFLSYDNGFYKKCALCNQELDINRVKRASFIPRFSLNVGDTISMLLMKREKCASFPVPVNVSNADFPYAFSEESRFSNVVFCSKDDLQSLIQIEILTLEDELVESIREGSDRVKSISDALETIKKEFSMMSSLSIKSKPPKYEYTDLDISKLKQIMQYDNVYYQAEDGSNIFLCPLNWKCIVHEYTENNQCFPLRISAKILEIERYIITPDFVNRYRYLKYLPMGSSVSFVELDLSAVVSQMTLKRFGKELKRKDENRFHKEKLDKILTLEKIKQENSFNVSTGFICLNSLMNETDNILDEDFVPLTPLQVCPPMIPAVDEKRMTFAEKMKKQLPNAAGKSVLLTESLEDKQNQIRGISVQDCLVLRRQGKKTQRK